MTAVVQLTENAKERMVDMLNEHNKQVVRLSLQGGGCAGFKYDWALDTASQPGDEVIKLPNGEFAIDDTSIMYLLGSIVDYKKEVFGSYFTIENPASTSSCGCGESIGF
jgi:iron-sulfur cluster assembly accessory protein